MSIVPSGEEKSAGEENYSARRPIDQLCNGAAAILNKNPTIIIIKPKLNPCVILWLSETETILYIDSKFVKPVYEYIKPAPNKIKQEDNPKAYQIYLTNKIINLGV